MLITIHVPMIMSVDPIAQAYPHGSSSQEVPGKIFAPCAAGWNDRPMSLNHLEQEVATVLRENEGRDPYSIIPHDLFQQLRGKFIVICGAEVAIFDTRPEAEQKIQTAGWQNVLIKAVPSALADPEEAA
jgi:hypothetical protein